MGAHLLERDLDAPAQQEPLDDLKEGIGLSIGAYESLRSHLTEWVSDHHPYDMHGRSSPSIPDGGVGCEFQCAFRPVLPGYGDTTPGSSGSSRRSMGEGSRRPFRRGLPICPGILGGAGSKRATSSLSPLMNVTGWRRD